MHPSFRTLNLKDSLLVSVPGRSEDPQRSFASCPDCVVLLWQELYSSRPVSSVYGRKGLKLPPALAAFVNGVAVRLSRNVAMLGELCKADWVGQVVTMEPAIWGQGFLLTLGQEMVQFSPICSVGATGDTAASGQ